MIYLINEDNLKSIINCMGRGNISLLKCNGDFDKGIPTKLLYSVISDWKKQEKKVGGGKKYF